MSHLTIIKQYAVGEDLALGFLYVVCKGEQCECISSCMHGAVLIETL